MTRDEILAQYGGSQAPTDANSRQLAPTAPDPNASGLSQIMAGGLSQPMTRDEILAAYAPTDPREAVGAGFGQAIGLVGSDNPRYQSEKRLHPNYVAGGQGMGYGVDAGLALAGGPWMARGTLPIIATGLAKGGKLAEALAEPSAVVHGSKHLEMLMKYGGRSARMGAEYLRGNPQGARELMVDALKEKFPKAWSDAQKEAAAADRAFSLAPEAQPAPQASEPTPPGTGALSAEMRAALKRNKFRHDYSTGEWRDLLAPGE